MKKILFIVATVVCFVSIYFIIDTYAIFESKITVPTESNLAVWNISVNDNNITGLDNVFIVDNVIWSSSEYVQDGKAAPGLSAYFNIIINPNDTEVSVRYDITIDFDNLENKEFSLISIEDENGDILIRTGKNTYSNTFTVEEIKNKKTNNLKIKILWNNNENNNEQDSLLSKTPDAQVAIPVIINFTQYLGETIEEYKE